MEPEICTKMLRNLSEKLRAKFPVTKFPMEASPVEGQSLQQKYKKRRKKGQTN